MTPRPIFDSSGARVRHYSLGPPKARKARTTPEADFQKQVVTYLSYALPRGEYRIRAGLEGAKRTGKSRMDYSALGGASGWPDLMLFHRRSRTFRWLELKIGKNDTTDNQDEVLADLGDHAAVCWTLSDVETALISWGVTPRVPPSKANRYSL